MTETVEKTDVTESKEVICPVCTNFEPQAWRKNMCRNCFHSLDEHDAENETTVEDKKQANDKVNDLQKKKSESDTFKKKGEPPKTLPKLSKTPQVSNTTLKQTDNKSPIPSSPTKKSAPAKLPLSKSTENVTEKNKSAPCILPTSKSSEDIKGKSKMQTTPTLKGISKQTTEVKTQETSKQTEKSEETQRTPTSPAPAALNKWKLNENKLLQKDKGTYVDENKKDIKQTQPGKKSTEEIKKDNKQTQIGKDKKSDDLNKKSIEESKKESKQFGKDNKVEDLNKKTIEDKNIKTESNKSAVNDKSLGKDKVLGSSKDTTGKSKTDDASKVRQFAKSFGSDLEESRFNSLDRSKRDKSSPTKAPAAPVNDQCKSGIKNPSPLESTQKVASPSVNKEKRELSALNEKINKFASLTQDKHERAYSALDRSRLSEERTAVLKEAKCTTADGKRIDAELEDLRTKFKNMEKQCTILQQENDKLKSGLQEKENIESKLKIQKSDVENAIKGLQNTLSSMESRCNKLEDDNSVLLDKLKSQQKEQQESMTAENSAEIKDMEVKLSESEDDVEHIKSENETLREEIQDLKMEMSEMYDSFRDQEAEEFRDLQRELEMTAKNCRVLQFKLRKAERRTEQIEVDRQAYEEKLHLLQNQFQDEDARAHIRSIEDELRMAKEVSVRLHDELDILDDKRQKVEEDNSHLTRLLEQSDKKQFRLEMEVDKLRDQLADLRKQLAERSQPGTPSTEEASDRKTLLGRIGKQGSQEQEVSQLMKELYDSMERETDLKDQLKFADEEVKSMRLKLEEMEEENDNLSQQLKKMSAAHVTKREEVSRQFGGKAEVTEAEVELKVQLDLNEQDLLLSKKKIQDIGNENEKLKEEISQLKKIIYEKEQLLQVMPEPSSPNAYYEDKLKEMQVDADDLRWKIIEKDREIDSLYIQLNNFQTRQSKLRKSHSFDSEYLQVSDLKKHVDFLTQENSELKEKVHELQEERIETLRKSKSPIRIESQVFESKSRLSPAPCNKGNQQSLSDANGISNKTSLSNNYVPPSDASVEITAENRNKMESEKINDITRDSELELENKRLQQKVSELMSENELLRSRDADELRQTAADSDHATAKGESREELMDTVLDLEDEIESLSDKLKKKNEEIASYIEKEKLNHKQLEKLEDEYRKKELELLSELEYSQDRNDILSNLLDIVKERADNAEHELERIAASIASDSSDRSARVVSICSDISTGSDEVFVGTSPGASPVSPGSPESPIKRQVIQKDWDNQFRKRIDCLERLLAEERQKLAVTEKKLALVSTESLSTAMSDDAKLFAREKDLLQAEIQEGKKLLKIATDQIKGLRERVFTLEEENRCLRANMQTDSEESENEKTPSYKIDEKDHFQMNVDDGGNINKVDDIYYKQRITSLEQELQEAEEKWKSKCSAIEKEKKESEQRLRQLIDDSESVKGSLKGFKEDVHKKQKQLQDIENRITENSDILKRKEEIINEQEEIIKQREEDLQSLLDQISHRDNEIRDLREKLQSKDIRLKEKDEIIHTLKESNESKQEEINYQKDEIIELNETIEHKQNEIDELVVHSPKTENVTKAEWEQENVRLKGDLDAMATNLGKLHTDNSTLQEELEKAKQALSEAMVLWNKDRSEIEIAHNIAKEKLRMFEEGVEKKEGQIVALLRKETHKLLESKERLVTEQRVAKIENEANIRTLKHEKLKLQEELTQKIRQLTSEMTSNDSMKEELERLKAQEEVAYQIQYHEKVLRAEYLAMKVRYETRLENLQKEHMKLLNVLDKLQREKDLNQDMIKGVQKGMGTMKETYNKDLENWAEERMVLERHIKEIETSRLLATELENKVEELKQQLADQEYERAEIINRMTTERSAWEVQRSTMQSRINQLEEKLSTATYSQTRTKDMQSRMEVAWEAERQEQKRLLSEAHTLALDLQRQLKCRDDEHARERRALLDQLKKLRSELDEEQLLRQDRLNQIEANSRQVEELKRKLRDVSSRSEKEQEASMRDKVDLVRRLAEFRRVHKRDQRRIEDVLSQLTRLRELASIVVDSENEDNESDLMGRLELLTTEKTVQLHPAENQQQRINEVVLQYMKESLKEIHFAADNLSRPSSRGSSDDERKKLRRSISSSELDILMREEATTEQQLEYFRDSRRNTPTKFSESQHVRLTRNPSCNGPGDIKDREDSGSDILPETEPGSLIDRQYKIMSDVHYEQGITTRFPAPPPSFLLPRSTRTVVNSYSSSTTEISSRVVPNSISLTLLNQDKLSLSNSALPNSLSADSSPTEFQSNLSIPDNTSLRKTQNENLTTNKISQKSAREKFFESDNCQTKNFHQSFDRLAPDTHKPTLNGVSEYRLKNGDSVYNDSKPSSSINSAQSQETSHISSDDSQHKPAHTKKKRKLFKKSVSMDSSTVNNTLANAGVSAISPGAPSSLSPFELFAAVKRKLKPSLKRSTSLTERRKGAGHSDDELFVKRKHHLNKSSDSLYSKDNSLAESPISTPVSNVPQTPDSGTLIPPPTPPISLMNRKIMPQIKESSEGVILRKGRTKDKKNTRPRSQSADRAHSGPASLKQEVLYDENITTPFSHQSPFSETSV